MKKKLTALLLCLTLLLPLAGCTRPTEDAVLSTAKPDNPSPAVTNAPDPGNETGGTEPSSPAETQPVSLSGNETTPVTARNLAADFAPAVKTDPAPAADNIAAEDTVPLSDFALRLFRESLADDENTMISPVSVLYALAMTANGAKGNTLAQMEETFGLTVPELNALLRAYRNCLPSTEYDKLSIANSIWFRDSGINVNEDFLRTNAENYGAALYEAPFDDVTKDEINRWVHDNTFGLIGGILDKIPPEAVMYLINAVAFDAEWQRPYGEKQVDPDGVFTRADGTAETVSLMHSSESVYLHDENTAGFLKYYKNANYAFCALLPDEGIAIGDYAASLTGEKFRNLMDSAMGGYDITAAIPKFESEYDVEMSDILKNMGMTDAFDGGSADFTGLGTSPMGNIYISRVLHKTYISVDEKGTKAAAVTAVEAVAECIPEQRTVICDRPFVYAVIDTQTKLPLFIGTVMEVNS